MQKLLIVIVGKRDFIADIEILIPFFHFKFFLRDFNLWRKVIDHFDCDPFCLSFVDLIFQKIIAQFTKRERRIAADDDLPVGNDLIALLHPRFDLNAVNAFYESAGVDRLIDPYRFRSFYK